MPTALKNRRGFTLFELLIVVLLIAVLYGVFINKMEQRTAGTAPKEVTLETLKSALALFPAEREREVICTEPCKECTVFIDGNPVKEATFPLFDTVPTVWKKDRYGQLQTVKFLPLSDPDSGVKDVCFRYQLFRNGSGSAFIVQTDEKHYYVFKPYMHPVRSVASVDAAADAFDDRTLLPTEQRHFNF